MKSLIAALAIVTIALCSSVSFAQTYKPDWATKVVLAGGGTSLVNTTTLLAPGGNSNTITFPATGPTLGYVLTTDASGNLSFTNPATATTLAGDVSGAAGTNTINAANTGISGRLVSAINSAVSSLIDIAHGGTNSNATPTNGGVAYGSGTAYAFSAAGTLGMTLHSAGAGTPTWSLLNLASATEVTGILSPVNGGTGVANLATSTLTLGGPVTFSGAFATTITVTGPTSVTLPTSGTLIASGSAAGGDLAGTYPNPTIAATAGAGNDAVAAINLGTGIINTANGGTGIATAPTPGSVVYGATATTQGYTAAGTTGMTLHSAGAGTPTWSLLNLASATEVTGILSPVNGGTGVANLVGSTLTLGGPVTFAGAFATTITSTAATNVTLPTTGTLLSSGAGFNTNGVLYATSATAIASTTVGAANQVLTSNGAGFAPTFQNSGATITFAPSNVNTFVTTPVNNFALTSSQTVYFLQNTTGANVNLTGMLAQASNRLIILINNSVGAANTITLTDKDVLSTDVNQFHLQGASPIIVGVDGTVTLIYDGTAINSTGATGAWRVISTF